MAVRRSTQKSVSQLTLDGVGDIERAAADLFASQKEAEDRPQLYRIMYTPPRQPKDVEMCGLLSQWLCRYYLGEL